MAPGQQGALLAAGLALLAAVVSSEAATANGALEDVFTDPLSSGLALAVGGVVLVALWLFVAPSKSKDGSAACADTPERLRVFARWAQQQIQDSKADQHRQMLDDVIFTFAAYAQRLQKGSNGAVRKAAVERMIVLIELLETPNVNRALRTVNWAWLREWDQRMLEPREARLRCTAVLPIIVCAAEVQRSQRMRGSDQGSPGLAYIACWCTDFLDRADVRAFLGVPAAPSTPSSLVKGIDCMTPGALYSDDSSEEEDEGSPDRRSSSFDMLDPQSPSFSPSGQDSGAGEFCDMKRRRFEGQEHCWDLADATEGMVRGEHYLEDHRKVRSKSAMLELVEVDLLKASKEMVHYAASSQGRIPRLRQDGDDRFFFIVNFRLHPIQFAITWAVPTSADWLSKPEGVLFKRFREMSTEEKHLRVKVLPKVLEGPWLVKKGVPDRPGVVGKKLQVDYFQRENHLEVSINCISSPAGRRLVQLLTGAARHFSMELFIILEGQRSDELPERILAGVSVFKGDLAKIRTR